MLILTRKQGEAVMIGDYVKVTVLGVYGRQVRLGFEAPAKTIVHREEVYLRVKSENPSTTPPPDHTKREGRPGWKRRWRELQRLVKSGDASE